MANGNGSKLLERKEVEVSPELARHYLTFNKFPAQRALRESWVVVLADKILDGEFRYGNISFAHIGGDVSFNGFELNYPYMIDGQHVCEAIDLADRAVPCIVEKWECKDAVSISNLYRQFNILIRSKGDQEKVELLALGLDWPRWLGSLVVSSAACVEASKVGYSSPLPPSHSPTVKTQKAIFTTERKVELLRRYIPQGNFLYSLISGGETESWHLKRVPVVYCIFKTYSINQEACKEFWTAVKHGENMNGNDPRFQLREFLRQVMVRGGGGRRRSASRHEFEYKCFQSWNNWRKDRNVKLTYSPDRDVPKPR